MTNPQEDKVLGVVNPTDQDLEDLGDLVDWDLLAAAALADRLAAAKKSTLPPEKSNLPPEKSSLPLKNPR